MDCMEKHNTHILLEKGYLPRFSQRFMLKKDWENARYTLFTAWIWSFFRTFFQRKGDITRQLLCRPFEPWNRPGVGSEHDWKSRGRCIANVRISRAFRATPQSTSVKALTCSSKRTFLINYVVTVPSRRAGQVVEEDLVWWMCDGQLKARTIYRHGLAPSGEISQKAIKGRSYSGH